MGARVGASDLANEQGTRGAGLNFQEIEMDTAPRYIVRTRVPVYDGRDAICGATHYVEPMVYGTLEGATARAWMIDRMDCEVDSYVYDLETRKIVRWSRPVEPQPAIEDEGIPF